MNDLNKCRQYTKMAIPINKELKAWRGVAINYEQLQKCDLEEGFYKEAKENLMQGMPYAIKANDSYALCLYYLGFGKLSALDNEIDSANYYFDKSLEKAEISNDLRNKYQVYIAKAEFLKKLTPDNKIALLDSAFNAAKSTGYEAGIGNAANLLSAIYDEKKNKDSSMFYFHIYRTSFDSLFSENNRRNVVIKEAAWMIKRKEIELHHLQDVSQIQKRDLIFKNALLLGTVILLGLMITVAFFIYKNIQYKKKRAESAFKQKITETKMESLRAQMNPHFIFNSLNSIENFMMKNEKREASDFLNKFSALIRVILESSRIQLVPFNKDFEAIKIYVELEQLRFNYKFSFQTKIDPELLNGDYNVPPLLIQPYVENAILHGLSQSEEKSLELCISVSLKNEYINYIIEDNGIGRAQSGKYKKHNNPNHKSVGIQLTQERIDIFSLQQKADGEVSIKDLYDQNNKPCGTQVKVKIKAV
ncbi:MAG: histidine kinase [Ginsengibacter sp.]